MASKSYQLGANPHLSFQACTGDVRIQSWDLEEVQLVFGRAEATRVEEAAGGLTIGGLMPEGANVPAGATVSMQHCEGDVHAAGVAGLRIEQHRGDLSLHNVGQVELATVQGDVKVRQARAMQAKTVHGDLFIAGIEESVSVAVVRGDISLEGAKGQLVLKDITGDLVIRNPEGRLEAQHVTGDVALSGNLTSGEYHVETVGDVKIYLEPTSNVGLDLRAELGRVDCGLALVEACESAQTLVGTMGQGAARVQVVTHTGDIRLRPLGADQVRHEMEKERIRAEAHARREAERAQRLAERAQRASERLAEKVERATSRARRWELNLGGARQEKAPGEGLEDERVAILKMLAEGKLTAEQAEGLLNALEG